MATPTIPEVSGKIDTTKHLLRHAVEAYVLNNSKGDFSHLSVEWLTTSTISDFALTDKCSGLLATEWLTK